MSARSLYARTHVPSDPRSNRALGVCALVYTRRLFSTVYSGLGSSVANLTLSIWFRGLSLHEVSSWAVEAIDPPFHWVKRPPDGTFFERDLLRLRGSPLACALTSRTEGHVVLELLARSAPQQATIDFQTLFRRLVAEGDPGMAECILASTRADVYPWFTHTFHRTLTPNRIVVERATRVQEYRAGQPGYWHRAGARLHFVGTSALVRANAPFPTAHADRIGASVVPVPTGWVYDCGWPGAGRRAQQQGSLPLRRRWIRER